MLSYDDEHRFLCNFGFSYSEPETLLRARLAYYRLSRTKTLELQGE